MKWIKKGLIFKPDSSYDWMRTHAWVPVVEAIGNGIFKVYFSGRNAENLSQTGYFTFDIREPSKIIALSSEPVIKLGKLGSFDDSATVACSLVNHEKKKYLYYVGWMQGKRVRYYPTIGLAISTDDGKTFQKYSQAPLLERNDDDPYGMASPSVIFDDGVWRMWYASYRRWDLRGNEPWPHYELRYAESNDGIHWKRDGIVCIGSDDQEAVARPYVLKENGLYKMWYCYRFVKDTYRIGYAESLDAKKWTVMNDKVGIDVSPNSWDSEMIEYPALFLHENKKHLLYNGNNFGYEGIGLAVEE